MRLTLVDYGVGNMHSIAKALEGAGAAVAATSDPAEILRAEALVFPGVGAFDKVMEGLAGIRTNLREKLAAGTPCLAVCIGMQILYESSDEGKAPGIALLPGRVETLKHPRLPHMGWNDVDHGGDPVFAGIPAGSAFYFVHSYAPPGGAAKSIATTAYGAPFTSAVRTANTLGFQFHPEKSSDLGRRLLKNFVEFAARVPSVP